MHVLSIVVILAGSGFQIGCSMERATIPSYLQGKRLTQASAFPAKHQEAIAAASRAVEKPNEFFVEIEDSKESETILHLWHESAFYPENLGMTGNPGGKCRDIRFDTRTRRIISTLLWQ